MSGEHFQYGAVAAILLVIVLGLVTFAHYALGDKKSLDRDASSSLIAGAAMLVLVLGVVMLALTR